MAKKAHQTAVPATNFEAPAERPHYETIAMRAYELWTQRGCPIGSPEVDWERAEQELLTQGLTIETAQTQAA